MYRYDYLCILVAIASHTYILLTLTITNSYKWLGHHFIPVVQQTMTMTMTSGDHCQCAIVGESTAPPQANESKGQLDQCIALSIIITMTTNHASQRVVGIENAILRSSAAFVGRLTGETLFASKVAANEHVLPTAHWPNARHLVERSALCCGLGVVHCQYVRSSFGQCVGGIDSVLAYHLRDCQHQRMRTKRARLARASERASEYVRDTWRCA